MKLDRKLNLVIPIYGEPTTIGSTSVENIVAYVHATPILPPVFDKYFMVIGKTFNAIYAGGLGLVAGPRLAAKIIRSTAQDMGVWDGPEGVQNGLVADIRRNATVLLPGPNGWEQRPFEGAATRGELTEEDAAEVENSLSFFTVASSMHKRSEIESIMKVVSEIWGAQISFSNCTEFVNSLPTRTTHASTGAKAIASST